ncbi:hypothetical protein HK100_012042 [Physocladia obscura]|uniref:3'-5' exonuclease domain-containing protein n=1 Tax=Physocladia obscura TaxID=109957 RepID=A0AAD5XGJ2_9FUNG|nr:hypothetical protein HK100_012042 [Physocladia obscura]
MSKKRGLVATSESFLGGAIAGAKHKKLPASHPLPARPEMKAEQSPVFSRNPGAGSILPSVSQQRQRQQQQHWQRQKALPAAARFPTRNDYVVPTGNHRDYNKSMKKSFMTSFTAIIQLLNFAFKNKETLQKSTFDKMSDTDKAKLLLGKEKMVNYIPQLTERGLLLSAVGSMISQYIPTGWKPFWLSRHHSGGLASYLAFFPRVFKLNRGGAVSTDSWTTPSGNVVADQDRVSFSDSIMSTVTFPVIVANPDAERIFDEYESSGFDPPLAIAADLPFPLIPCFLPVGYDIVYGVDASLCDAFIISRLVSRIEPDGTWIEHENLILGFDTESTQEFFTKQAANQPPCLLQISTQNACLLVHGSAIQSLPQSVKWVLENPRIKKVVVSAGQEARDLAKFGIRPASLLEIVAPKLDTLTPVAKVAVVAKTATADEATSVISGGGEVGKRQLSLATMAAMYLGLKMAKPRSLQVGNWKNSLSEPQKNYAATDAWVSLLVFQALQVPPPISNSNENIWWDDGQTLLRRTSCFNATPAMEVHLVTNGFEKLRGTGKENGGISVFAERPEKRVELSFLKAVYSTV